MSEVKGNGLFAAMAKVLAKVGYVQKKGHNSFHRYSYAQEADLMDHIRPILAEYGIALFVSNMEPKIEVIKDGRGKDAYLATVGMKFTLAHGESGQSMESVFYGQGMANDDKALYKAYTGAQKYFLMKTFMISTGDDPEKDEPLDKSQPPTKQEKLIRRIGAMLCGDEMEGHKLSKTELERFWIWVCSTKQVEAPTDLTVEQLTDLGKSLKDKQPKERGTWAAQRAAEHKMAS